MTRSAEADTAAQPFDLTGRAVIVTGSSRGIGRAIARRLAQAGARVVVTSRKIDVCREVADDINERLKAERAFAWPSSLGDKSSLAALVEECRNRWGRIDGLVCNAASNPYYGPMSGLSDEQFRKVFENNVLANHWLIQLALPDLRRRSSGFVTIVSSIGGLAGSAVIGAYNISKAADLQLVRNLAVELGPSGIRVNALAPGLIRTDFSRAIWEDEATLEHHTALTPLRRIGLPDEVAGAAVFLASDAASFITGQTIVIDGGATISNGL